ncbi:unnamed protein product [Ixodes persulcatus]
MFNVILQQINIVLSQSGCYTDFNFYSGNNSRTFLQIISLFVAISSLSCLFKNVNVEFFRTMKGESSKCFFFFFQSVV